MSEKLNILILTGTSMKELVIGNDLYEIVDLDK